MGEVRSYRWLGFRPVAVPRELFAAILERIQRLGVPPPVPQCSYGSFQVGHVSGCGPHTKAGGIS